MSQGQTKKQRSKAYSGVFQNNPIGKGILTDLKEAFDGDCFDENPYVMARKCGARDVLLYIEERIKDYEIS